MKTKFILVAVILGASAAAQAGTLITPTLWAEDPVNFACNLTNVGDERRKVSTRIVNGTNGETILYKRMKLAPRHTMDTTVPGLPKPGGPLYCVFRFRGSKDDFRGSGKLWAGPDAENSSDITAIGAE